MNWSLMQESLPAVLQGLKITILLTVIVMAISLVAGIVVALARLSRFRLLRAIVHAYVELFRSTPLLVQLVYIYFALPLIGIRFPAFVAAVVALSLHYTAFMSEVYRAGIEGIPKGQTDAATALGMSKRKMYTVVVLPQATRAVLPVLGNYLIQLFKDTSLASVITLQELLFAGQIIAARTFDYFTIYTLVFVVYFLIGYPAILGVRWLERKVARGYARDVVAKVTDVPGQMQGVV
jgi:His/Glu/Gln/Arg/opine family amino acid ABC transporter permease subunit